MSELIYDFGNLCCFRCNRLPERVTTTPLPNRDAYHIDIQCHGVSQSLQFSQQQLINCDSRLGINRMIQDHATILHAPTGQLTYRGIPIVTDPPLPGELAVHLSETGVTESNALERAQLANQLCNLGLISRRTALEAAGLDMEATKPELQDWEPYGWEFHCEYCDRDARIATDRRRRFDRRTLKVQCHGRQRTVVITPTEYALPDDQFREWVDSQLDFLRNPHPLPPVPNQTFDLTMRLREMYMAAGYSLEGTILERPTFLTPTDVESFFSRRGVESRPIASHAVNFNGITWDLYTTTQPVGSPPAELPRGTALICGIPMDLEDFTKYLGRCHDLVPNMRLQRIYIRDDDFAAVLRLIDQYDRGGFHREGNTVYWRAIDILAVRNKPVNPLDALDIASRPFMYFNANSVARFIHVPWEGEVSPPPAPHPLPQLEERSQTRRIFLPDEEE